MPIANPADFASSQTCFAPAKKSSLHIRRRQIAGVEFGDRIDFEIFFLPISRYPKFGIRLLIKIFLEQNGVRLT